MTKSARPRITQYRPAPSAPCPCGSGLAFKLCCADHLTGTTNFALTQKLLKDKKYKQAIESARASLTQYTIWHRSHTEPAVRNGMPKKGTLFETDLHALADYVDTLFRCYLKAGRLDELAPVLERLRDNINDVAWQRKITYFHALTALGADWDEVAGRGELKKLGKVTQDDDAETLQLYLDLFGDELSFSEKHEIIDWILAASKELSDRLHYVGLRAVLYHAIGDHKRAAEELDRIIEEARSVDTTILSAYTRHRLAMIIDLLGTIRSDQETLEEAASIFESLLEDDLWTERGRAELLALLGQNYQRQAKWEAAKAALIKAIETAHIPIHSVFLSQTLLQLNQPDEATKVLSDAPFDALEPAEQVDYAFTTASLAIRTGDKSKLEEAKAVLKSVTPEAPLFREMRDEYLLSVQESLAAGSPSSPSSQRTKKFLTGLGRYISDYLILKPALMGVGVDVGKIVGDLSRQASDSAKPGKSNHQQQPANPKNNS